MKTPPAGSEAAYDVVALGNLWAVLSLAFALAAVYSRKLIGLLPWHLQGYTLWPPAVVLVVPPLAALGALSGAIAVWRERSSFLARLGLWLNLAIFALGCLVAGAAWLYRRS
jgi:hypothetical protein